MTVFQNPVNTPVMSGFEQQVSKAVTGGETVNYTVTPVYRGSEGTPIGITIEAAGNRGFSLNVTVLNRK